MATAHIKKQTQPVEYDIADDDDVYVTRSPSSARRYWQPPAQRNSLPAQQGMLIRRASKGSYTNNGMASKAVVPPMVDVRRRFPLMAVMLGMVVAITLAVALSFFGGWWRIHQDDVLYGRPRTFQLDAVVGHNDSVAHPTHFILLNLNRHIEIIEFPGGDATHARIYQGPILFGDGQDLTPVTAEVRDVNGDRKPDLVLFIQDQRLVFINTGNTFRPQQPGDHVNL